MSTDALSVTICPNSSLLSINDPSPAHLSVATIPLSIRLSLCCLYIPSYISLELSSVWLPPIRFEGMARAWATDLFLRFMIFIIFPRSFWFWLSISRYLFFSARHPSALIWENFLGSLWSTDFYMVNRFPTKCLCC